jgi:hypothetical protein
MCAVGGCLDTSLIIDFLAAYLFPNGERVIDEFAATGISLGGQFIYSCQNINALADLYRSRHMASLADR